MDRHRTDLRLILFLICLLLPVSVATSYFDTRWMSSWLMSGSYWILFLVIAVSGVLVLREAWDNRHRIIPVLVRHRSGIIIVILASLFLQVHEPHAFKVLPEEFNIGSTSRSMHLLREFSVEEVGYSGSAGTRVQARLSDSYPMYPLLLSMVHGLTGYRAENAFMLNGLLGLVACFLVYALVAGWMGTIYGKLSVLLLVVLPAFHESVTGGGGEVLELCLLLSMLIQSRICLERDGYRRRGLLIFSGFLLACTSPVGSIWSLFLFSVLGFMPDTGSIGNRLFWLSPILWVYPAALWSLVADPVFIPSVSVGFTRLSESMVYLFDMDSLFSNSVFLSALGVVSSVFWLIHMVRDRKREQEPIAHEWLMLGFVMILGLSALASMLLTSNGWSDPVAAKESIPLYFVVVLLVPFVMRFGFGLVAFPKTLLVIPMIVAVSTNGTWSVWGAPGRIKDAESMGLRYLDHVLTSKLSPRDSLYIGAGSSGAIVRGWSAMPTNYANRIPERIEVMMQIDYFRNIYVGAFFSEVPFGSESETISPRFLLEPVFELAIKDNLGFRVSRVIGVAEAVPGYDSNPSDLPLPFPRPGSPRSEGLNYMMDLLLRPVSVLPKDSSK